MRAIAEQARNVGGFELYKDINVALGAEIGPQHGPEKGHAADMSLPAKFRKLLSVNRYVRHQSAPLGRENRSNFKDFQRFVPSVVAEFILARGDRHRLFETRCLSASA